jgi:hypothetical protein
VPDAEQIDDLKRAAGLRHERSDDGCLVGGKSRLEGHDASEAAALFDLGDLKAL